MITPEEIVALYNQRRSAMAPVNAKRMQVRDAYNGELHVTLPDIGRSDPPAVANLLNKGIDQMAMRVASTLPSIFCPPRDETKKREIDAAEVRRKALYGWWQGNKLDLFVPRRARQLLGYAQSPVCLWPDFKRGIPIWRERDSFGTYPSACTNPGDMTPDDTIFAYTAPYSYVNARYPDAFIRLHRREQPHRDSRLVLLDYMDADELVTIVLSDGPAQDDTLGNAYPIVTGQGSGFLGVRPFEELERLPNRAGMNLAVIPGRITLDKMVGQFDGMLSIYRQMAHLTALELISVEKAIFPDTYLIGREGRQPKMLSGPHDGRSGLINVVQDGDIKELNSGPGFQTNPMIDRLERSQRLDAGIPAEFGGECMDEETEILTSAGWRRYDQVEAGDTVLTLNHETGMSQWQAVEQMNVFPAEPRLMVEMEGPRHSSLSTRNHRWAVRNWSGKRVWKDSTQLSQHDQIPIAAMNADLPTEAKHSDALVEAVAWLYTEGHIRYEDHKPARSQISQSWTHNSENVERIRACLTVLFGPATKNWRSLSGCGQGGVGHDGIPRWSEEAPAKNGVIKFNLSRHATEIVACHAPWKVPTFHFLLQLTAAQLELFLNVSMLADNCGPDRFGQRDPARTEAFAFATILAGRAVSFQTRVKTDERPEWPDESTAYLVRSRKRRFVKPVESAFRGASTVRDVVHNGIVWCPTTQNGTWYARRRGTVYFTGNSASNIRTGKRGDAVLSAAVDFPVQEQQKVLAASLQEENKRAIAVAKGWFGARQQSFYVSWKGAKGRVDYVANDVFTTDDNIVAYSHGGSDLNGLTILVGQLVGMGGMSMQTAMELLPIIEDPEKEHDRTIKESLEKALLAAVQQKVNAGEIAPVDAAWLMQQVGQNKLELAEAIIKLDVRVQERQAAAQEQQADPAMADPMAGLATGTAAEAQVVPPSIGGPNESQDNLASLLGKLRMPQMSLPSERPAV